MKKTPLKRGTKTLKRSGFKRKPKAKTSKVRKASKTDGIKKVTKRSKNPTSYLNIPATRWKGYKGIAWTIFSRFIRKRDFIKYKGKCVSCNRVLPTWQKIADAGHYVSVARGGALLRFNEKNVHMQCKKCNNPKWSSDASIPFGIEIDRRLGAGTAENLYAMSFKTGKEPTPTEYKKMVEVYKDKFEKLKYE